MLEPCAVDKSRLDVLPAAVRRVFYLSREGTHTEHEVAPDPNPRVLSELSRADAVVFGMGSLFTSIAPSLILRGVGEAVAARSVPKILLLNGAVDREITQGGAGPMAASNIVQAVTDALNRRDAKRVQQLHHPPSAYITAVLVPQGCPIEVDEGRLAGMGVGRVLRVPSHPASAPGAALYDPEGLVAAIREVVQTHGCSTQHVLRA